MKLFDPDVLDILEGYNERYQALSQRIEELEERIQEAAGFDLPPDTEQLGALVNAKRRVKEEAADLLQEILDGLE